MSDTQDVEALVARLESLADCDARAGEPLGKCMREAATALRTLARERDEARELAKAIEGNEEQIKEAIEKAGFTSDTWIVHALEQACERSDEWYTRASSLEAQLAGAKEGLEPFAKAAEVKLCGGDHWTDEKSIQPTDVAFYITFGHLRRARAVYEALASAPASAPVVSHERPSGETQAGLLLTDETQAFGGPPAGYHPLPDGMRCRCIRLWQDGKGNHWCCKPTSASAPASAGVGIYIASKTTHGARWRELRASGAPIISTWIDEAEQGATSDWPDLWHRCVTEASQCAALIVYREDGEVLKGAWVEVGAALASGRPVYAVGCDEFSVKHHRGITLVKSLDEALRLFRSCLTPSEGRGGKEVRS